MPPKQKGQNVRGRDKIFRHAVEHVHIGVGHAVLGNLSLQLAAEGERESSRSASPLTAHTPAAGTLSQQQQQAILHGRPAFYVELNALLLSHSSKDFKSFRWEVLEKCETPALFQLNQRDIAQRLLTCLLARGGGVFSSKSKASAVVVDGAADRGETEEGFEAFARLTIAFARDAGEQFLSYYEVFQQAVQAGLFDAHGNLMPDVNRLQLVYAVQAAWAREIIPFCRAAATSPATTTTTATATATAAEAASPSPGEGAPKETERTAQRRAHSRKLIRRIVHVYVQQLRDTKAYIRRLAAEWLAYVCRLCRPVLPVVCEMACTDILNDYESKALGEMAALGGSDDAHDDGSDAAHPESAVDEEEEEGDDGGSSSNSSAVANKSASPRTAVDRDAVWRQSLVEAFVLNELPSHPIQDGLKYFAAELFRGIRGSLSTSFEAFYVELLTSFLLLPPGAGAAPGTHDGVLLCVGNLLPREDDAAGGEPTSVAHDANAVDRQQPQQSRSRVDSVSFAMPADDRWHAVFTHEHAVAEPPSMTLAARAVVSAIGSTAVSSAMESVLAETRRRSQAGLRANGSPSLDADEEQEEAARPSHRLLRAVVACLPLPPRSSHTASSSSSPLSHHVRLLGALLSGASLFLWSDAREAELLTEAARKLRGAFSPMTTVALRGGGALDVGILDAASAILELTCPLCYVSVPFSSSSGRNWLLTAQRLFLPLAKDAVEVALSMANSTAAPLSSAARLVLFAFAQDVLQKNFACCLAEERRLGEEATSGYSHATNDDDDDDDDIYVGSDRDRGGVSAHSQGEDHEEGFVDDSLSSRHDSSGVRHREASRLRARTSTATEVVPSYLTPLALTLLHRICTDFWSSASDALQVLLQSPASVERHSTPKDHEEEEESALLATSARQNAAYGVVGDALLLARLTADRTRHVRSSPLQQLLRLVTESASQKKKKKEKKEKNAQGQDEGTGAGEALLTVLETMLYRLVSVTEAATAQLARRAPPPPSSSHATVSKCEKTHLGSTVANAQEWVLLHPHAQRLSQRSMDWLSVALPLFGVVAAATPASATHSTTSAHVRVKLLGILQQIKTFSSFEVPAAAAAAVGEDDAGRSGELLSVLWATGYSLYAAVAVLLVNLGAIDRRRRRGDGISSSAARSTESVGNVDEKESIRHLCETIDVLAKGFASQQQQQQPRCRQLGEADSSDDLEEDVLSADPPAVLTEATRDRLYHGTELLLSSLLAHAATHTPAIATASEAKAARRRQGSDERLARDIDNLHSQLSATSQKQLVEVILLECLTAPVQSLRVQSLQLLKILCRADVPASRRFCGAAAVEGSFFDALLGAEYFNPLNQTGSLDGVREALAKLSFAAESGSLTDPLQRVILARAMIGLLHVKFAGAWPVAVRILTALVRHERTSIMPTAASASTAVQTAPDGSDGGDSDSASGADDGDADGIATASTTAAAAPGDGGRRARQRLPPLVWETVVRCYARRCVFGDVFSSPSSRAVASPRQDDRDEAATAPGALEDAETLRPCLYHLQFSDFQRHQRGELVSKAFSFMQYIGSAVGGDAAEPGAASAVARNDRKRVGTASDLWTTAATSGGGTSAVLVALAEDDGEVLRWGTHAGELLFASSSSGAARGRQRGGRTQASTDRTTLAKTFLSALSEMVTDCAKRDRTLQLVEELVMELAALQRNAHPWQQASSLGTGVAMIAGSASKKLEERLLLAMKACSAAPSTVLSAQERRRLPASVVAAVDRRNAALADIFISYTPDALGALQRASVDNLKRLKVEPYCTYHAQLTPYSDNTKALFGFLAAFHVETDIPASWQADYIATALTIALPKLIANVPKEKKRDQAVLQRRLMGFIAHLSAAAPHTPADNYFGAAAAGADTPLIATVMDSLVQRLVFNRVGSVARKDGEASAASAAMLQPADFDFLLLWQRWVAQGCHGADGVEPGSGHSTRRLERLCRQLGSTVQLLSSLLHAVGTRFAPYVPSCLHLVLQSYLLACKGLLHERVDAALLACRVGALATSAGRPSAADQSTVAPCASCIAVQRQTQRALSSSAVSATLAQLRRASVGVVAQLFELFPGAVERALAASPGLLLAPSAAAATKPVRDALPAAALTVTELEQSVFARYLVALCRNSQGTTHDESAGVAARGAALTATSGKSYVTPVLRLLTSWTQSEHLLPLLALFPNAVVDTLTEVFAVARADGGAPVPTSGGAVVHRASALAVHQGLQCLNSLLVLGDTPVPEPYATLASALTDVPAAAGRSAGRGAVGHDRPRRQATITLSHALLAKHVTPIFTALYRLVVRGADADAVSANATGTSRSRLSKGLKERGPATSGKAWRQARRSVMSFRVSLWKELMQTISLLSRYVTEASPRDPGAEHEVGGMLARLTEVALQVVTHPACVADESTALAALEVVDKLYRVVPSAELRADRHLRPLLHLTNVLTLPEARLRLCGTVKYVLAHKWCSLSATSALDDDNNNDKDNGEAHGGARQASADAQHAQRCAVGRAICCLNSFDANNEDLTKYDFELRYHTFHSLTHFFNNGNYGTLAAARVTAAAAAAQPGGGGVEGPADVSEDVDEAASPVKEPVDGVRHEREYTGELDVRIPVHATLAPRLCVDGFLALLASVTFLLRDPESVIRALAVQLLYAMMRYASATRLSTASKRRVRDTQDSATAAESTAAEAAKEQEARAAVAAYSQHVLDDVVRRELLPSLRRGVVAKDVNIRMDHMNVFGALGRYYPDAFPSFARLYSSSTEQNFYQNVGHVQSKCRLHALALLRREAAQLHVRDLLRVFVPFLMTAVKDFAQGKRELRNLTESKAKGYCDAVLTTIASVTQQLPWEAYYRVLSLFLGSASANSAMRLPMLRGVVQMLGNFSYLDDEQDSTSPVSGAEKGAATVSNTHARAQEELEDLSSDDDDDAAAAGLEDEEEAQLASALRARRRHFRHLRIMQVLEQDVLPQLFDFIGDGGKSKKSLGLLTSASSELKGTQQHTITTLRRQQQKETKDTSTTKNAILQLPVAIAITRIVKKFPEERSNFYVEHILDEVVLKLRTKNDKHRDSARRILGVLLKETGPGKLHFVVQKLKDNLVHGYQLHVLGYTVVTLLYQLYEPQNAAVLGADVLGKTNGGSSTSRKQKGAQRTGGRGAGSGSDADGSDDDGEGAGAADSSGVLRAINDAKLHHQAQRRRRLEGQRGGGGGADADGRGSAAETASRARRADAKPLPSPAAQQEKEDAEVERAEEELLAELLPYYSNGTTASSSSFATFDYTYGVSCLTGLMDELMRIFLDDYLGEVGMQKEQTELMSTMVEVKRNRSLQGFTLLAHHCEAGRVMDAFLHRITWVLTPPSDTSVDASQLHGSERARALLMRELRSKYLTVSKSASADSVFVSKVRVLATRVARGLLSNPTIRLDQTFAQVRELLRRHNDVREAKIKAFEAKDGTRRIRGNAHLLIHKAQHDSWKEQLDRNFVVAPVPERVDVDFSTHTTLATQQKQKLKVYKGRYGKEVQEAAVDFYREDPTTAVVLDTLDEFLTKFLLSVLKRVLGIGKEAQFSTAAVQLDLLRKRKERLRDKQGDGPTDDDDGGNKDGGDDNEEEEEEEDASSLSPQELDENGEDDLDAFAEEQQQQQQPTGGAEATDSTGAVQADAEDAVGAEPEASGGRARQRHVSKLTISFTVQYRELLEGLVPVVLTTLQGEGSDAVIANALDCLLALVSLRPSLSSVNELNARLFRTVTGYFGRGGSIKQRAMRVCAAVIAHQPFKLADDQAAALVRLVRAEIVERSQFLPMSLSLFYAILGKHSHVVEVYDLIDLITELMVHLGSKPVVARKCAMILTRFLTEFRLTTDKFRSHIDQLCKNLDYPEIAGRFAILDCLELLFARLPVVVLRSEAPTLMMPLAAMVSGCEWVSCRERAGRVLQALARYAGVDVLVPALAGWLYGSGGSSSRPHRAMAAQVWATILAALTKAYHLPEPGRSLKAGMPDASDDEKEAFEASCEWSLAGVLDGCTYDQFKAAGVKVPTTRSPRTADAANSTSEAAGELADLSSVSKKDRSRAEMKGWSYVFYSLRCAEALLTALPQVYYPVLGPRLLPAITHRLLLHTHPWVQAVALRILRHYLYQYVEQDSLYLQEAAAPTVLAALDRHQVEEKTAAVERLPYRLPPLSPPRQTTRAATGAGTPRDAASAVASHAQQQWLPRALATFDELAGLLKGLLTLVGLSDVAHEHQKANRAIQEDASRTEGLKILVYVTKALSHTATSMLLALRLVSGEVAATDAAAARAQARRIRRHIQREYATLHRHMHALAQPVIEQRAVTNYMVRTATLVQFFGGLVSVLPTAACDADVGADDDELEASEHPTAEPLVARQSLLDDATRWLLADGMRVLTLVRQTVLPLLSVALRCAAGRGPTPQLRGIATFANQSAVVTRAQLEERRDALCASSAAAPARIDEADEASVEAAAARVGKKRIRGASAETERTSGTSLAPARKAARRGDRTASAAASDTPSLDAVLTALTTVLADVSSTRQEKRVAKDVCRHLKRNRHEMEKERGRPRARLSGPKSSTQRSRRASKA